MTEREWPHVVAVNDGTGDASGMHLYLDGVEITIVTGDTLGSNSILINQTVNIGAATGNGQYFTGKIDDARIYNRALTAAEIKQLYKLGTVIISQ